MASIGPYPSDGLGSLLTSFSFLCLSLTLGFPGLQTYHRSHMADASSYYLPPVRLTRTPGMYQVRDGSQRLSEFLGKTPVVDEVTR